MWKLKNVETIWCNGTSADIYSTFCYMTSWRLTRQQRKSYLLKQRHVCYNSKILCQFIQTLAQNLYSLHLQHQPFTNCLAVTLHVVWHSSQYSLGTLRYITSPESRQPFTSFFVITFHVPWDSSLQVWVYWKQKSYAQKSTMTSHITLAAFAHNFKLSW